MYQQSVWSIKSDRVHPALLETGCGRVSVHLAEIIAYQYKDANFQLDRPGTLCSPISSEWFLRKALHRDCRLCASKSVELRG